MVLRIWDIDADDLPDADKCVGAGGSDPYLIFTLMFDDDDFITVRTETVVNASRVHVRFPDRLEIPLPEMFVAGKYPPKLTPGGKQMPCLVVAMWDDDAMADGQEGINADDLMGEITLELHHTRLKRYVDRATFDGFGGLHAFRVSFKCAAVPAAHLHGLGEGYM